MEPSYIRQPQVRLRRRRCVESTAPRLGSDAALTWHSGGQASDRLRRNASPRPVRWRPTTFGLRIAQERLTRPARSRGSGHCRFRRLPTRTPRAPVGRGRRPHVGTALDSPVQQQIAPGQTGSDHQWRRRVSPTRRVAARPSWHRVWRTEPPDAGDPWTRSHHGGEAEIRGVGRSGGVLHPVRHAAELALSCGTSIPVRDASRRSRSSPTRPEEGGVRARVPTTRTVTQTPSLTASSVPWCSWPTAARPAGGQARVSEFTARLGERCRPRHTRACLAHRARPAPVIGSRRFWQAAHTRLTRLRESGIPDAGAGHRHRPDQCPRLCRTPGIDHRTPTGTRPVRRPEVVGPDRRVRGLRRRVDGQRSVWSPKASTCHGLRWRLRHQRVDAAVLRSSHRLVRALAPARETASVFLLSVPVLLEPGQRDGSPKCDHVLGKPHHESDGPWTTS